MVVLGRSEFSRCVLDREYKGGILSGEMRDFLFVHKRKEHNMSKIRIFSAAVIIGLIAGCYRPQVDDAHLIISPADTKLMETQGYLAPQAGEADAVERLAAARDAYLTALQELTGYYRSTGNATKLRWAENELKSVMQTAQYRYLMPGEWVSGQLAPTSQIPEADALYKDAMKLYQEAGGHFVVIDNDKFRESLRLFNKVISDYPSSDKIDYAAYRAGRIYEHFKDYELAAVFYQRCFQWNEKTPFPARFRAAYIMDNRLKMRSEALNLYRLAIQKESRYENNSEYAKLRIAQLTVSKSADSGPEPVLDKD